jgi:hypothetical protein
MLDTGQSIFIVVLTVAASLLFMWGLNRIWPWNKRHAHNDLIGWQLSILGTTYAVILGFMLFTVWTDFGAAELNVDNEANSLINVYRLSAGLPEDVGGQMKMLARYYANTVLDKDWPEMAADFSPDASEKVNQEMWKMLMSIKTASPSELLAEDHSISELSAMTEHRRTRVLQSRFRLPTVLWCVLIMGGAVTIASASMFGSANTGLHTLQIFAFSLVIALVLIAVEDIDRPFEGSVHVQDVAFRRALDSMKN